MSTLKPAAFALCLLVAPAALAQAPPAPSNAPAAPAPPPLAVPGHHQPTQAEINALEVQRQGRTQVPQPQIREQADVEKLYDELMREPAPNGTH